MLTPKQKRFVDEYLVDLNATQAAIRTGYSFGSARQIGHALLTKVDIQEAIAERRKALSEATGATPERVVEKLWNIAKADPRELVEVRVGCCRHCHGEGFKHQRTVAEMNAAREAFLLKGGRPEDFDEEGGIGFNPLLPPNSECPECGGDGLARTVLKDTRQLSPEASALYAGAKQSRFGIEIQMHSKLDALEKLAKHLGLYEKDNSQKTPPVPSLISLVPMLSGDVIKPGDGRFTEEV